LELDMLWEDAIQKEVDLMDLGLSTLLLVETYFLKNYLIKNGL